MVVWYLQLPSQIQTIVGKLEGEREVTLGFVNLLRITGLDKLMEGKVEVERHFLNCFAKEDLSIVYVARTCQ